MSFGISVGGYVISNHRVVGADGTPCHTVVFPEWGRTVHRAAERTLVHQSISWRSSLWICEDGATYNQDVAGACPAMWSEYWPDGGLPAYFLTCDTETGECESRYDGGGDGGARVAGIRCRGFSRS